MTEIYIAYLCNFILSEWALTVTAISYYSFSET